MKTCSKADIALAKPQAAYLKDFENAVSKRKGNSKEDETAQYLLDSLQQELGVQVAGQEADAKQTVAQATQEEATKHHKSGQAHKERQEYDKAIASFQKAYDIRKQCLGEAHEATKTSLEALAATYDAQVRSYVAGPAKDPKKAIACFEQVLQCKLKLYGQAPHAEVANAYNNLGTAYGQQQAYDRAVVHFQKALAVYQQCLGETHSTTKLCVSNLAYVRKKLAAQEAATKAADKASEQGS